MPDQPSPRRSFQFRLRTLMIMVALLAVPCAYLGREAKIVREREAFLEGRAYFATGNPFEDERKPTVPWIMSLLGAKPIYMIRVYSPADAYRAATLFPEAIIEGPESNDH